MVVRRRFIFWLIRAYIRKSGRTILLSFFAGLLIFFIILFSSRFLDKIVPIYRETVTGTVGAYTTDNLPPFIVEKVADGLTTVDATGAVKPAIAASWEILDHGKKYIFHLNKNAYFSDGIKIDSGLINYNFKDVSLARPDKDTVVFKLREEYAPFLITVSRPIFHSGLAGKGEYKIESIKLNGNFVQSITLVNVKDKFDIKKYIFYPSIEALKYAYVLGEVSTALGLDAPQFNKTSYNDFRNTKVTRTTNYNKLVTLFYNNNDSILSDKKVRLALSYAMPAEYSQGEKAFLPYSPTSIYYNKELEDKQQNYDHARLLLSASGAASDEGRLRLTIKTSPKYTVLAQDLAKNFAKIGIITEIKQVDSVPTDYQIYLADFTISKDPDQYPLWHSDQIRNITKYKNLRIDKLLEDGRRTSDVGERRIIYADFQKFLIEDVPASFLFFPYEYDISRK
jgi:peptide/nickel transport system substrate-binding protein